MFYLKIYNLLTSTEDLKASWQSVLAPACVPLTSSYCDLLFSCALGSGVRSDLGKDSQGGLITSQAKRVGAIFGSAGYISGRRFQMDLE